MPRPAMAKANRASIVLLTIETGRASGAAPGVCGSGHGSSLPLLGKR